METGGKVRSKDLEQRCDDGTGRGDYHHIRALVCVVIAACDSRKP